MPKPIKMTMPGIGLVDAIEVGVSESTERWTDITLEDGSVLRLKSVVLGAIRIEGQYDMEGKPVYSLKINQVMVVVSAPDHLRKGAEGGPKGVQ